MVKWRSQPSAEVAGCSRTGERARTSPLPTKPLPAGLMVTLPWAPVPLPMESGRGGCGDLSDATHLGLSYIRG